MESTVFPTGFRFRLTDVECVMYYLRFKVTGKKFPFEVISEINIYRYSPSDLPDKSLLNSKDREWFFFCPTEWKYNSGGRMKRATENGYWKATGKDRFVHHRGRVVGMIKSLVFYQGHPPGGERTDWVMLEYRLEDQKLIDVGVAQDAFVLCKVFHKNGPSPSIGAQYEAHIDEEDWDNNSPVCTSFLTGDPSVSCAVTHPLPTSGSSALMITSGPEVSSLEPSAEPAPCSVPASLTVLDNNSHENSDQDNQENNIVLVGGVEGNAILSSLPDLPNWQATVIQPFADSYLEQGDLDFSLDFINNLEQQMPSQNYDSCGNPQFYNGGGSFSSTQYAQCSAEIHPFANTSLEQADLDISPKSVNNLEQQMPSLNYNSCDNPQLYNGGRCFSSTQYPWSSGEIQPFVDFDISPNSIKNLEQPFGDSYLELADLYIPLNPINNLYYGFESFSSTQHPPSSAEVEPSTDPFLVMADLDTPPSPIHILVQISTTNCNPHIDPRSYYEGGSSSSMQYTVSSAQVSCLTAETDGVGDISNIPQVNYDGTSTLSDTN